jgi:hypothetical protein
MLNNIFSTSYLLKKRAQREKNESAHLLLERNPLYLCVKITLGEKSKKYIYYKQITL